MAYRESSGEVPIEEWLDELGQMEPRALAKCLERILRLSHLGYEMRRPHADNLGDGIFELRAKSGNVHYRILYFFHGQNVVVLSHGLTKKGKVPEGDIKRAIQRMNHVKRDPDTHTTEWSIDE